MKDRTIILQALLNLSLVMCEICRESGMGKHECENECRKCNNVNI